jgi:hypothetical protein
MSTGTLVTNPRIGARKVQTAPPKECKFVTTFFIMNKGTLCSFLIKILSNTGLFEVVNFGFRTGCAFKIFCKKNCSV